MNFAKISTAAYFSIVFSITVSTAFAQQNISVTPDKNTFDLKVNQAIGTESSLELRWYPPEGMDNFVIEFRNNATNESRQLSVSEQNFVEIGKINPNHDYSFTVFAIDASAKIIAQTPEEKWLGKESLSLLYEKTASRPSLKATAPILKTTLISLERSTFPFIFATIRVDTNEITVHDLTQANFSVYEDAELQTDFFDVTPVNGGNNRIVDFIFLVDNSGSMSPKQKSVIENINAFIDSLTARQIDIRLGVVRFGQQSDDGQPILMNNGEMTDNVDFIKGLFAQMTDDGAIEPGLEAIYQAATTFSFPPGSQRHFLLITDEDSDGGDLDQTQIVCQSNGITVHVAVDTSIGTTILDYSGANSIREITNGEFFDIMGPYKNILTQIDEAIRSTYIIRYRALNDIFNAQQRVLRIEVNAFEQSDFITGYYTPGAAPIIQRTQSTIALSNTAKIAGTPLTIQARITDLVAPFVKNATLFYRTSNTTFYVPIPMIAINDNTYEVQIPDTAVVTPSVDYYIIATDGHATSSDPAVDPGTFPYQIAVLPNQPAQITHSPVTNGRPGEDIVISATVVDSTNYLDKVELYYREIGILLFESVAMVPVGESMFEGIIPGDKITNKGVEYYIRAVDNLGFASKHGVHTFFPSDCLTSILKDFNDGNFQGWAPNDSSKWDVEQVNGDFVYRLREANNLGDEYSLLPINWKDFELDLDAKAIDNNNFFIIFGVKTFSNSTTKSYYLSFASDGVKLSYSLSADSVVILASAPDDFVSDNQFHHIQIARQFPGIEVIVDAQVLFTVNDESFPNGCVGIGAYKSQALFDDINITGNGCSNKIYATISIPSGLTAKAGSIIKVPVVVSSLKDINLAQFTIEYDGNDLQFDNALIGSDVSGFTISQLNLNPPFTPMTPGTNQNVIVRIAGENSAYFTGVGQEVIYLFFTVIGSVEKVSPLAIDPEYNHTFLTSKDSEGLVSNQMLLSNGDVTIVTITDIETTTPNQLPSEFALLQNYPNPFNPETTIEFQIPNKTRVALRIYNLRGQEITTLVNAEKEAGFFRVSWNGKDSFGRQVSTGIYVYQIQAGDYVESRKLILLR